MGLYVVGALVDGFAVEVVGPFKVVGTIDGTDEGLAVALLVVVGTLVGANEVGGLLAGAGVASWRRAGNE